MGTIFYLIQNTHGFFAVDICNFPMRPALAIHSEIYILPIGRLLFTMVIRYLR